MPMPCEIAVKSVVPSIRAFIAIELTNTYQMKQNDVADILGITQTAVSKYTRQVRGAVIKFDDSDEIKAMMQQVTYNIAGKRLSQRDFPLKFCEICQIARRIGLMCELCKRNDPSVNIEECQTCKSTSLACEGL